MLQRKHLSLTYLELPAKEQEQAPLMVMLHGYGSNEKDLIQLAPFLHPGCTWISARAPHMLDFGMFGWFPLEFTPAGITVDYEAARTARDQCIGFLSDLIKEYRPPGNRIFLTGFSQGAVMSYLIAFAAPELLHGVIAFSGQLPQKQQVPEENLPIFSKLPVLVIHGIFDEVLPIAKGKETNIYLKNLVADLTYREFPMGHEISAAAITLASGWLSDRVSHITG
jgi:phospholipase/carboxylesterase